MTGTADIDVAIVGAGPYGLSIASHLAQRGVEYRQFGTPMQNWREFMPKGMILRSEGFASNISDPYHELTLADFVRERKLPLRSYETPIPLDVFCDYAQWFIDQQGLPIEDTRIERLARANGGSILELSTGEEIRARRVVVAVGTKHFARVPTELSLLPPERCSHSSDHARLDSFAGRDVTVIGLGQSARETAALLHEGGARVRMVGRASRIGWNQFPIPMDRPPSERLRVPIAGMGPGWESWFYEHAPSVFRRLPDDRRGRIVLTKFGPAGSWWLKDRVVGKVPIVLGRTLRGAQPTADGVQLELNGPDGPETIGTEHVLAATGYQVDVNNLKFLDSDLRSSLESTGGYPVVSSGFESSVPGVHFVGMAAARSFGPLMRFVLGTDFAANSFVRHTDGRAGTVAAVRERLIRAR